MGITGTEVAKEAADMILTDDNFASIVNGVEEGRIIFDNLKKSIAYTLSSNIPEISPFLLFQTVGIPLPLSTFLILLVDLGTDLAPAISMAYEGKEADIMQRKPRNPDVDKLVTWRLISFSYLQIGMLQALSGFYAYMVVLTSYGLRPLMLPGLDNGRTFDYTPGDETRLRDGYYLWCWNTDIRDEYNKRCHYYPNIFEFNPETYNSDDWDAWLNNDDRDYARPAKEHIIDIMNIFPCEQLLYEPVTPYQMGLTNDNPNNQTQISYAIFRNCWGDISSNIYGPNVIFEYFKRETYQSSLIRNRRCYDEDYYDVYYPGAGNNVPPYCNNIDYPIKPRTWLSGTNEEFEGLSLFPIQTRTRQNALRQAQTAYFIDIIVVQWADLMICKTRMRSLFEQGMSNTFMNYSLIFTLVLGSFLIYIPLSNTLVQTNPIRFVEWTSGVPFCILIYIYDEMRKGWIRQFPKGWIHRNTYW